MSTDITKYLKIGEEASYATEASEMSETMDPSDAGLNSASDDKLIYEGMGGLDRRAGLGTYSTSGDIKCPLDDAATGWFWKWLLGKHSVTGASAPYTHSFTPALGGTMTSFTAAIGKDITEQRFLGNVVDSVSLEASDEWAELTISCLGAKDTSGSLAETVEYTEGTYFTGPNGTLTRDSNDVTADVNSVTLEIKANANVEDSSGFGSRFPTKAVRGGMEVTFTAELWFTTMDELERFWGDSSGPSVDTIQEFAYTLSFGDNVDFIMPRLVYTDAQQPTDGRNAIKQTLTARALYDDDSKVGPIEVSLTNDREDYEDAS